MEVFKITKVQKTNPVFIGGFLRKTCRRRILWIRIASCC